MKTFQENRRKPTYWAVLALFWDQKAPENKAHNVLGNIVVYIHAKYRKDRIKTVGAFSIWKKKVDRQTDKRTTDGSAYDKPS